ncbi:hypothetical protein GGU10DRAFT_382482 [Lentinula aff. detonsa]|uniref:Uncharacterized protein n=1 Tax=Lentinula aff. detonsa TaxID=2804958 RepID=A0AA38L243_9AGAR|nr:hypothetical protein GGU10DRAFT_382482 [Lentinula aff. detonsa]
MLDGNQPPHALDFSGANMGAPRTLNIQRAFPITTTRNRILASKLTSSHTITPRLSISSQCTRDRILAKTRNEKRALPQSLTMRPTMILSQTKPSDPPHLPYSITTRKAKKGNEIKRSHLRPNVRASERIHAWTTPFATASRSNDAQEYHPDIVQKSELAMITALADNTLSSYGAGILRFNQFCDQYCVPESKRMPAEERLISGFVYASGTISIKPHGQLIRDKFA